jgi:UDP-N-acetylglucosamine 2-epimerase (non-hydrolysing)
MAGRRRLMIVLGTRPEAIKLAPVILGARERPEDFETVVVATGQHRELVDQVLGLFDLAVDVSLAIMQPDQRLAYVTGAVLDGVGRAVREWRPDRVVVQGDTTTAFAGALAAFYERVPVAHVEAGLRTYDRGHPFPEELNRRLISHIADDHFAPTAAARQNLLSEGVPAERIRVTGNTGIDALLLTLARHGGHRDLARRAGRTLLLTAHRRENHGAPLEAICRAVQALLDAFPDLRVVWPVHPNPRVSETVRARLGGHPRAELCAPLDYRAFVLAMSEADVILTDSGGVQEEAPSLGKPVLVLREATERLEGVAAGTARLVGTDERAIVEETSALLLHGDRDWRITRGRNPYGDGQAAGRILSALAGRTARQPRALPALGAAA